MANYVYTMNRVGKIVPPKRQILKDISLSFFPGAKIGVLGLNGSGKSTLLKIMAGIDTDIQGEARPMPGLNIGYLPQEPQLDPEKTVRQEVESGLGEAFEAQAKLEAVYAAYADEDADFDALAKEQERLESIIAASDGGNLNLQLEMAADALRLPPWDAKIGVLSGGEKRRVALCKLLLSKPDMLLLDEPTNHLDAESVEWLEQFLLRFPGTVVGITHDRYFLDNAAEWILELDRGSGIPMEGQLLVLAGPEAGAPEAGRSDRIGTPEGAAEGTRMVAPESEGTPGQVEGASGPLQRTVRIRIPEAQRDPGDLHPCGRAPGQ
jgi:sulfate-transporting ATPase